MALSTLVTDLNISKPGPRLRLGSWVRCWLGEGAVAVIGPLLERIGTGWLGVLAVGIWVVLFNPWLWVVMRWGLGWREEKRVMDEERKAREKE